MKNEFKNINQQLQFYNTPEATTKRLLELIDFKIENMEVLEPSAGQGSILKLLKEKYDNNNNNFYYCEYLDYNKQEIEKNIKGVNFICNDFLKIREYTDKQFDLIVANPPFNKNQDVEHVTKMIEILKDGGVVISILSNSWRKKQNQKRIKEFLSLLNNYDVELIELNDGDFKSIGLNIDTCILKIKKNFSLNNKNYDFTIKMPELEPEPLYVEDFERTVFDYFIYKQQREQPELKEIMKNIDLNTILIKMMKGEL